MTTSVAPAVLQPGAQLTTSAAAYLTAPALTQWIIKQAVFTNVGAAAVTLTVYRVPSGGAAGATNEIIPARAIAIGGVDLAPELSNMVLNAGDMIQALCSAAASVNVFASGFAAS